MRSVASVIAPHDTTVPKRWHQVPDKTLFGIPPYVLWDAIDFEVAGHLLDSTEKNRAL